jgi:2,4-dienoyl-CoA reductase-like NADH-dependent reductase (Old Yellow Enzyme family)
MGIQLAHAGRKASTMRPWDEKKMAEIGEGGWQAVSSTAVAFEGYPAPRALTVEEIGELVKDFADAARRAVAVGFDVIEIHAAHGYLLHQFYSPISNDRTDEYGGSIDNRIRFLMEVTQAVRAAIGADVALFVRISATDWVDEGWNIMDSIELSMKLKAAGVDLIDVSSGGAVHNAPIKATPGFQVPFAAAIRKEAGIPTAAVGLITEPEQAQYIIETEEADAVFLARAMLRNPRWAMNAAEALGVKIAWSLPLDRGRTI